MYEMLMAMNITDDEMYSVYRRAMTPVLHAHGGSFGYDCKVSEVLISETPEPFNRVFTIRFPDTETKDAFFSHPDYLQIKAEYFSRSVADVTMIADYQK
ncbi:DUF1330 domain-containing protein [Aliamphritea hakodatensis]|uniref:DUF1330 domain-containing protein n=1 Tax=Aliamphritea hakodatensis TaxID=2895352 RepID=UPI0022FD6728|nr:DUF1330 domain-containing protein [Aliamphritea hakodatensis]